MLVLTRRIGQAIQIGEDVTVYFLGHNNGQIRLGFEAPIEVPILRTELIKRAATKQPE